MHPPVTHWVCSVAERVQDVVTECKEFEGHKDDVLCMAVSPDGSQLATGDYEGRVIVWNLHTGEKRLALFHRSDRRAHACSNLVHASLASILTGAAYT